MKPEIKQSLINVNILKQETIVKTNRIAYFAHHLARCKRTQDKMQLSAILAGLIVLHSELCRLLADEVNELGHKIFE